MKEPPKLSLVPPGGVAPDSSFEAIKALEASMKTMPKLMDLLGKITWMRFQAYKKAGFTDAQALQLCCTSTH
jgi:hypothetical protein